MNKQNLYTIGSIIFMTGVGISSYKLAKRIDNLLIEREDGTISNKQLYKHASIQFNPFHYYYVALALYIVTVVYTKSY